MLNICLLLRNWGSLPLIKLLKANFLQNWSI